MITTRAFKGGIKRKVASVISSSILVMMLCAICLTYFVGSGLLQNTIGRQYKQMASALALDVATGIAGEVEDVETYASRHLWIDAIK